MKKFLFAFIFVMITNVCFAEDIYVVTENGFTKYIRTETVTAKVLPKTTQDSLFELKYSLICIPDKATLDRLKSQTFDNKLSYQKQSFTFTCSFNKNTNQWNPDGSLWLNSDEYWSNSPEKCLYESHGNIPGGMYYGDSPEALFNRKVIVTVYEYVVSHGLLEYVSTKSPS
ncbi:putative membrane protein [Propionispora sp. 2/2-37]|uniref:hypothetical protein n=1 Tax=Propionispora sp. 2/2-37 TaxID=1677858 RepID=UPI0006BB8C50|nr:hypothetical protein [Propionispora sp. 2/2-37]CUH97384.1 putative membrane protein [Propionispora sp. 2/2-37]